MPSPGRRIFCNRTLNLRSIRAIGYDMDYTLIHYRVEDWERAAYEAARARLAAEGWPVESLSFDKDLVIRGLIIDVELGNVVKANRFGYVNQAMHGTRVLDFEEQRAIYSRLPISLSNPRFFFLNTLFSISEGCLFAQLVELMETQRLPLALSYTELFRKVRFAIDEVHVEGELKARITADPDSYVELDPETPLALLDQKHAGKKLVLITNSEWSFTRDMMAYSFDRFLPDGMTWKSLFDVILVGARKPDFFMIRNALFEVVDDNGLLRPVPGGRIQPGGTYLGGHAGQVEAGLGMSGDEVLYVGDHIYGDVNVSKRVVSWRTALVLRELENEVEVAATFQPRQDELQRLMTQKEALELEQSQLRLAILRRKHTYAQHSAVSPGHIHRRAREIRQELRTLDESIAPLARASAELANPRWGLLLHAGNDKSHLARQIERYADIYMSRVSNFLHQTPFVYLRAPRGLLPHDQTAGPALP
jgi:HAD superfamily 5'-nucleotidase-like hydrolase